MAKYSNYHDVLNRYLEFTHMSITIMIVKISYYLEIMVLFFENKNKAFFVK